MSRRLPSLIRRLPVKRLEIAPGFIAALCLLRLLVEPGVFWSFLAAAAAHEAGHLTAAFALHVKVTGIRLDALDARIRMQVSSYRQEAICALAGPAASVLLCIAMRKADPACAAISLLLGLFNALPVFPLDGGRALRAMLGLFLPLSRAEAISGWIGLAVCAAGLVGALLGVRKFGLGMMPVAVWGILLLRVLRYAQEEGACFLPAGRV